MDNILIDEVFLVTAPTNTPSKFKTVFGMGFLNEDWNGKLSMKIKQKQLLRRKANNAK